MAKLKLRPGLSSIDQVRTVDDIVTMVEFVDWEMRCTGGQMYVIYPPDGGEPITINNSTSFGDWRTVQNARSLARKAGLFEAVDNKIIESAAESKLRADQQRERAEQLIQDINDDTAAQAATEGNTVAKRDIMELVERCQRVGWTTKALGSDKSHYIIHPPKGRPVTVHVASTVRHYPQTVIAQLTRVGLLDAEQQLEPSKIRTTTITTTDIDEQLDGDQILPGMPADEVCAEDDSEIGEPEATVPPSGVGDNPCGITEWQGVEVAEWAWSRSPFGTQDQKAVELLLEDGNVVVACIKGDYVGPTYQSVARIHRRAAHPEILSPAAKSRMRAKELSEQAAARDAADAREAQQDAHRDAYSRPGGGAPVLTLQRASRGPVPMFAPVTKGGALPDQAQRLSQLLSGAGIAERMAATAASIAPISPAVTATPPRQDPVPQLEAALPLPLPVEPETTPEPVLEPAPVRVPEPVQEVITPRRIEATPPLARVGMAQVAAKVRPASIGAQASVSIPGAGAVPLADVVAKLQQLTQGGAAATELREQNEALAAQVAELSAKLDAATRQGQALAEQCIAKDATIRNMRQDQERDAATVAAAQQLQALLGNLMTTPAAA
jgi:hypothetical protein